MTPKKEKPKNLQPRQIHREKILVGLLSAGILAGIVASFASAIHTQELEQAEEEANETISAVFYQNTAQCEADMTKQQEQYAVFQQKYQSGQLAQPPTPPPMEATNCAPQMLAAEQEHHRTAPVYASTADCQSEGVQCEATSANEQVTGYRPVYGGTYLDLYDSPRDTYIYYGDRQYRVYAAHVVYQSSTPGLIVTPYGRVINQSTTGRVTVPRHTTFAAPSRPPGTSASGTIRGRSSQGFGSSFKSTGSGGK
jgi:type II secretory pathway pseudopilin PulG